MRWRQRRAGLVPAIGVLSGGLPRGFRLDARQAGIAPVLGHGEGILMAQQFTVAEHEREALLMGLGGMGAQDLGGHGERGEVVGMGGSEGNTPAWW